ncbi:MAG: hypothetical protein H7Y20_02825 [Bryobacteraceae bacterium]|nr:hypothetical protein [Bryobacteraceae bacterium]
MAAISSLSSWQLMFAVMLWLHPLFVVAQVALIGKQEKRLAVKINVKERTICQVDAELGLFQLSLDLGYQNVGHNSLVLYRYSNQIRSTFSADSEDAFSKGIFKKQYTGLFVYGELEPLTDKSIEEFAILKPHEVHYVQTKLELPVVLQGASKSAEASGLRPGTHIIGFKVRAWPDTSTKVADAAVKWKRLGDVWSSDIHVGPLTIQVPALTKVKACEP